MLLSKNLCCISHVFYDRNSERTARLTIPASDAVSAAVSEIRIVRADGRWNVVRVKAGDIQIFVYCGNVNFGGAGLAMAAVDTIPFEVIAQSVHHVSVITFAFA